MWHDKNSIKYCWLNHITGLYKAILVASRQLFNSLSISLWWLLPFRWMLHRNGFISVEVFGALPGAVKKWGWMDPGEQLCWWGGTGGVFHQRVLKKRWEAWWWVTTSSFSTSACRGHVCLHLELITVTTSSENLDVGKSTGILPRLFPWAIGSNVLFFFPVYGTFPSNNQIYADFLAQT